MDLEKLRCFRRIQLDAVRILLLKFQKIDLNYFGTFHNGVLETYMNMKMEL